MCNGPILKWGIGVFAPTSSKACSLVRFYWFVVCGRRGGIGAGREADAGYRIINRLFVFYIFAMSTVQTGWAPTCDSAHLWQHYNAAPLRDQVTGIMVQCPAQSHNHNTELASPCPFLLIPNARLGCDKYQCRKLLGLTVSAAI